MSPWIGEQIDCSQYKQTLHSPCDRPRRTVRPFELMENMSQVKPNSALPSSSSLSPVILIRVIGVVVMVCTVVLLHCCPSQCLTQSTQLDNSTSVPLWNHAGESPSSWIQSTSSSLFKPTATVATTNRKRHLMDVESGPAPPASFEDNVDSNHNSGLDAGENEDDEDDDDDDNDQTGTLKALIH